MDSKMHLKLGVISANIGSPLTEEQMEFASDFTSNTISFSDPGTGKTHTLIAGLIMAQTYHGVKGSSINCMSFTNAATNEMKKRYDKLCAKMAISPTVVFNTFHRLSRIIMKEAYPSIEVVGYIPVSDAVEIMSEFMKNIELDASDQNYVKKVLRCIDSMNSSLRFHPDNISKMYEFIELGMDIDKFQDLRVQWFINGIVQRKICQGDIPLYCLYALMSKPDIISKWKGIYEIMIVDEFQDLSLLHLQILNIISNTLIVIGDMKQQIYAFNGACPQIAVEYLKIRSDARICNLTKSFRCKQEISDFSTKVVLPNDTSVKCFEGNGSGGSISFVERRNMDWKQIAKDISDDVKIHRLAGARDIMFLYRNNASAIPIIEELYQLGVPYRCSRLVPIYELPIFKELCILANAAWQPNDTRAVTEALLLFPEFKGQKNSGKLPPIEIMEKTGKGIFDINFRYRENSSYEMLNAMAIARKKIEERKSAGIVLNNLLGVYDKYIIKGQWWRLDNTQEFYFNLVAPICNDKEYALMYAEETDKLSRNQNCINASMGIRCYTMHSAKGLEADDVYILDCDEGMFPNSKVFKNKVNSGCVYDAARDIRQERNLLYVAITRAKENVIISFSGESPTKLLTTIDNKEYARYDKVYEAEYVDSDDVDEFLKIYKLGRYKKNGKS